MPTLQSVIIFLHLFKLSHFLFLSSVAMLNLKQMEKQQTECYNKMHYINQMNKTSLLGSFKLSLCTLGLLLTQSVELWQPIMMACDD